MLYSQSVIQIERWKKKINSTKTNMQINNLRGVIQSTNKIMRPLRYYIKNTSKNEWRYAYVINHTLPTFLRVTRHLKSMITIVFNEEFNITRNTTENREATNSMQIKEAWHRIPGYIIIIGPIYYVLRAIIWSQVHISVSSTVSNDIHCRRFPGDVFNCDRTIPYAREYYRPRGSPTARLC